jgi:hypothetical protein
MVKSLARAAPILGRLGTLLVWWAALAAAYMLLVDTHSLAEFGACAAAALLGLVLGELARRQGVARLRVPLAALLWLGKQVLRVPADLGLLARELARALAGRHPAGRFHAVELDAGGGPRARGRCAAIELLGSLAPNTIVVGVDEHGAVVHQLKARAAERESVREMGL